MIQHSICPEFQRKFDNQKPLNIDLMVWLFCGVLFVSVLFSYSSTSHLVLALEQSQMSNGTLHDKFGVSDIYPTKQSGREWYMNMSNPTNDSLLSITFEPNLTRQTDGSWRISETNSDYSNPQIRINVDTPSGSEPWKNLEMTGYVKIVSTNSSSSLANRTANTTAQSNSSLTDGLVTHESEIEDIAWYARGGKRNDEEPCEGTALFGILHPNGIVSWKKSIWWTGGYTEERFNQKVTDQIFGKWIGWKVIMYNFEINNTTAVKMESYIDINNDGNWTKVTDFIDNGGWYARTTDEEFYSANCDRPKDYIVTNAGPIATFRADDLILDFKNFSIREIQPPANPNLSSTQVVSFIGK
jgi:hypothetical protein